MIQIQTTLFVLKKAIQFLQSTGAQTQTPTYNSSKQQCVRYNQPAYGQEVHTRTKCSSSSVQVHKLVQCMKKI